MAKRKSHSPPVESRPKRFGIAGSLLRRLAGGFESPEVLVLQVPTAQPQLLQLLQNFFGLSDRQFNIIVRMYSTDIPKTSSNDAGKEHPSFSSNANTSSLVAGSSMVNA